MANHASHAALPYPIKGARYTVLIPYLDADGDPTDPTTPDTEISEDNAAFTDCAEEASAASGSNGVAILTLTGAETDCSILALAAKVASGPKATLLTLSPMVLASIGTGTLSAGSAGGGTLGTLLGYDLTGCFIKTTGGTGGGGTGGANNQVRKIITYNTGSGAFTVAPNWETTPSTDTTYDVLLPDGVTLGMLKALNPATAGRTVVVDSAGLVDANAVKVGPTGSGTAQTARDVGASVLLSSGTGTGQLSLSSGAVLLQATQAGVTIPTVTTLTNAPSDSSGVTTLLSRLPSGLFTGLTNFAHWLGAIAGKQAANSTAQTEIRASGAGSGTYDATTDSQEALRDNTGTAGAGLTAVGDTSGTTTLLSRLTSTRAGYLDNLSAGAVALASSLTTLAGKFTGITLLAEWLGLIAGKQTGNSTARTELRATGAGSGTFDETTDSLEALKDDAASLGDVADAVLDEVVLGSYTLRQLVRGIAASGLGKLSGAATTTVTIRSADDTKNVVVATVDADGNRSAVTLDLT